MNVEGKTQIFRTSFQVCRHAEGNETVLLSGAVPLFRIEYMSVLWYWSPSLTRYPPH